MLFMILNSAMYEYVGPMLDFFTKAPKNECAWTWALGDVMSHGSRFLVDMTMDHSAMGHIECMVKETTLNPKVCTCNFLSVS